jgi:hypothetical protein
MNKLPVVVGDFDERIAATQVHLMNCVRMRWTVTRKLENKQVILSQMPAYVFPGYSGTYTYVSLRHVVSCILL